MSVGRHRQVNYFVVAGAFVAKPCRALPLARESLSLPSGEHSPAQLHSLELKQKNGLLDLTVSALLGFFISRRWPIQERRLGLDCSRAVFCTWSRWHTPEGGTNSVRSRRWFLEAFFRSGLLREIELSRLPRFYGTDSPRGCDIPWQHGCHFAFGLSDVRGDDWPDLLVTSRPADSRGRAVPACS